MTVFGIGDGVWFVVMIDGITTTKPAPIVGSHSCNCNVSSVVPIGGWDKCAWHAGSVFLLAAGTGFSAAADPKFEMFRVHCKDGYYSQNA